MERISKIFTFILAIMLLVGMFSDCVRRPESPVDIEKMRKDALTLFEGEFDGPGYLTLLCGKDNTLEGVRIDLPEIRKDGKIHGAAYAVFNLDGELILSAPLTGSDVYEERKNIDAVTVLKGIYGEYLLYENGTLDYVGSIGFEQFEINPEYYETCVIDESIFGSDMLNDNYGIDISDVMNSTVTAEYAM